MTGDAQNAVHDPPIHGSRTVRRQLGKRLRAERLRTSRTIAGVVAAGLFSESKMIKIENGRQTVQPGDVRELCALYGTSPEDIEALVQLARATGKGEFYENKTIVPRWLDLFLALETECAILHYWHPLLIPGIAQTSEYARAVIDPHHQMNEEEIADRLRLRDERRTALLQQTTKQVRIVLGAGALHLLIHSRDTMAKQRLFLEELNHRDNVGVFVLPNQVGAHPGLATPFYVLDFDDPEDPPVVYLEHLTGARYLEAPADVRAYQDAFSTLTKLSVPIEEFS